MPEPMKQIKLDAKQQRQWTETRAALMWSCPAFSHILFSLLNNDGGEMAAIFTDKVPIAATDGKNLILNPEKFFAFGLDERVFIVAHEIMHCILNHCALGYPMRKAGRVRYADGTELKYDAELMNIAMDLVINDMLISDKIGKFPTCGAHDPEVATAADSFMTAYKNLYRQTDGGKGGKGAGQGGFDIILDPGAGQGGDPGQAVADRSQTEWDTQVAAALAVQRLQGKQPGALERLLSEIVEPTVSWQEIIRAMFARKVGAGGYDWRKPDRRMIQRDIYTPQRAGNGCEAIVVAVDTSGSIGQKELNYFFAEMRGILEDVRPRTLFVVWCDSKVHKVDVVEDSGDIDTLKPHGGGGTDFQPVFDWMDAEGLIPDALVYLTDGYGSFPAGPPAYPVIWGCISGAVKYPFGDVVRIEIK